jgi:hypothetical protein
MINAKDFLNEVADRLGWPQIETLEKPQPRLQQRKLVRLLNRILKSVGGYNDWPFLRKEGSIVLVASVTTDSDSSEFVTATQNSDVLTVANSTFDKTFIGRAIQVNGDENVYRITAVPTVTQLTIDKPWVADSITVSDERIAFIAVDEYALPTDFDRPINSFKNFFSPHTITAITPEDFEDIRRTVPDITLDDPTVFTISGLNSGETNQVVRFYPYPKDARLLRFPYQRTHPEINSDNDKILYPQVYIDTLMDIMIQMANRDYENSGKYQQVLNDMIRKHNLQQANPGETDSRMRLEPANSVRVDMWDAYGSFGTNIDYGDFFDRGGTFRR